MEVSDYVGYVASEGDLFAAAAEHGDLAVEIEPCPGWDMRELVCHLGIVHLWAASNITYPKDDWLRISDLSDLAGHWPDLATAWPEDCDLRPGTAASARALISWYRATHANLVRVLQSAPADVQAFTFLPAPSPLAMWARRQASEIAIHRFDAQSARGIATRFDPHFASDMLDELLSGFGPRQFNIHADRERVLHVHAEDTDDHWWLTIGPQDIETSRHGTDADLTVAGTAAELYLAMWNRTPDTTVHLTGDTSVMDLWHNTCRVGSSD